MINEPHVIYLPLITHCERCARSCRRMSWGYFAVAAIYVGISAASFAHQSPYSGALLAACVAAFASLAVVERRRSRDWAIRAETERRDGISFARTLEDKMNPLRPALYVGPDA